ncbi:MAG: urease accessory protein UreD, partial [Nitrospirae bacterium]|nr:urease accessory protein UreD [Nitrospirota bacterium]
SSTAFILDSFTTGRNARGEHLSFKEYRSRTEIIYCDEPVVTERILLRPDIEDYDDLGFFESFTAVAVLYLIFDNLSLQCPLIADIKGLLDEADDIIGGVSALPSNGILVRFLSKSVIPLTKAVYSILPIFRKRVLCLDTPSSLNRFIL